MNTISPIRLVVADDQPVIMRGLGLILNTDEGVEVVGHAKDGYEVVELAKEHTPDIIIMDLQMPGQSGVAATRQITALNPDIRVVVLTTFDHDNLVFDAIRAGAQAYLLKDATESELLNTIRAVHRGESSLSPVIARKVMEQFRKDNRTDFDDSDHYFSDPRPLSDQRTLIQPDSGAAHTVLDVAHDSRDTESNKLLQSLTKKEERVLGLIADGLSNKEIAATVFLAEGTVKNYVSRIMDKLHARNRTELATRLHGKKSDS